MFQEVFEKSKAVNVRIIGFPMKSDFLSFFFFYLYFLLFCLLSKMLIYLDHWAILIWSITLFMLNLFLFVATATASPPTPLSSHFFLFPFFYALCLFYISEFCLLFNSSPFYRWFYLCLCTFQLINFKWTVVRAMLIDNFFKFLFDKSLFQSLSIN